MISLYRLAFVFCAVSIGSAASAQASSTPAPDSTSSDPAGNVVTKYLIRSGKLVLSSAASPGQTVVPDGTYTSDEGTLIVILEGRINRIQRGSGEIIDVASSRVNRQRVIMVTPSTNALMAVSEIALPSGMFKSEDGRNEFTILLGRPTAFSFRASP